MYRVFAYDFYYPSGGMNDLKLTTSSKDEVIEFFKNYHQTYDVIQICKDFELVFDSRYNHFCID